MNINPFHKRADPNLKSEPARNDITASRIRKRGQRIKNSKYLIYGPDPYHVDVDTSVLRDFRSGSLSSIQFQRIVYMKKIDFQKPKIKKGLHKYKLKYPSNPLIIISIKIIIRLFCEQSNRETWSQ